MPTTTVLELIVTVSLLLRCIGGRDVIIVAHGVTVEFTCTGPVDVSQPSWVLNGKLAEADGGCYRSTFKEAEGSNYTSTLIVKSNSTCNTFNIYCRIFKEVQLYLHNTTLVVQGRLPSPENVHINESVNSSTIRWSPPYSSLNNDIIHVDPHITQYTVYITDNYTGNIIVKENVTRTRFTFNISSDESCPMYQVSAWNAGGEGEKSVPMQGCIPRIPHEIATGIVALHGVVSQVLHIGLHVTEQCKVRRPDFFRITLMTSGRVTVNTTTVQYGQSGSQVTVTIKLPQNIDICSLIVSISAGNSAGISSPSEAVVVVCSGDSTDSTTTTSTSTTAASSSGSGSEGNNQQGNSTTLIAVFVGIIAVIGGVCIVAATVGIICYRGHRKEKFKKGEIEVKSNPAYDTVTLPNPPVTQVHTKPCAAYEGVVHVHH